MAPTDPKTAKAQKQALIQALNEHRLNTIGELRRVERVFADLGSSDVTQPMTAACQSPSYALRLSNASLTATQGSTTSTPTPSSPNSAP